MNKILLAVMIVVLLLPFTAASVFAHEGEPLGGCPDVFELHHMMDHGDPTDPMHNHIGSDADLNDDGYLCMKHVGLNGSNHLHVDNNLPLN